MTSFQNFINGQWTVASDEAVFEQRNPAALNEVTGVWPACSRDDAQVAIEAAQAAFPAWAKLGVRQRAAFLKRALALMIERRQGIAAIISMENGKTLAESLTEIDAAISEMDFQINEGLRLGGTTASSAKEGVFAYQNRVPLGVVSIISPWNFPFNVPCRKATPALMAGNTVVFKPASLTPQSGLEFAKLLIDADLPEGVLNFVTGGGSTVGEAFTTDPRIKAISFTGSTEVGIRISQKAAAQLTRCQLELGGKNPLIVLGDADLEDAAQAAVTGAFACAGQWCTSTSRLIVTDDIADSLVAKVLAKVKALKMGPGHAADTTLGPVCGEEQVRTITGYIELGLKEGAQLLCGGRRSDSGPLEQGCFIEPTVFDKVLPSMTIAQEEIFGPVLSIIRVADFEEALQVANDVRFGLSSSLFTNDLSRAFAFLEQTEVGLAHVNMLTAHKEPELSFGGVKASGFGVPEAGATGIEFFTEHKTVYLKHR